MADPRATPAAALGLERRLGSLDAAAIIVSNVIGSGIFLTPAIIAAMVPDARAMLAVWAAGGVIAFAGAMAYAELAALRPRAGGEYVYLREAFGPVLAFLTGWTSFVAGFSGAVAVSAVGLTTYLGRFIPAAGDSTPLLSLPLGVIELSLSRQGIVAIAAIVALSLVHIRGVGPGRLMQNVLATLKVCALLVLIALGLSMGEGTMQHITAGAPVTAAGWLLALVPVMFSYSGWNAAAYVAEEVRHPERFVPRALAIGTGSVILIYLLLNLLYIYSMPIERLAALEGSVVDVIAERLFGAAAGSIMGVVTIISIAASISAMIFAGPRVYYAMARDGLFFAQAGRVHPRYRTPAWSIAAQGVWSALLVLSGGFQQLLEYTGFAVVLFAGIAVSAIFPLRRRRGGDTRPFSALGYPWAPAIFVIASALMVGNAFWREPVPTSVGAGLIALGIPVYFAFRSSRRS